MKVVTAAWDSFKQAPVVAIIFTVMGAVGGFWFAKTQADNKVDLMQTQVAVYKDDVIRLTTQVKTKGDELLVCQSAPPVAPSCPPVDTAATKAQVSTLQAAVTERDKAIKAAEGKLDKCQEAQRNTAVKPSTDSGTACTTVLNRANQQCQQRVAMHAQEAEAITAKAVKEAREQQTAACKASQTQASVPQASTYRMISSDRYSPGQSVRVLDGTIYIAVDSLNKLTADVRTNMTGSDTTLTLRPGQQFLITQGSKTYVVDIPTIDAYGVYIKFGSR